MKYHRKKKHTVKQSELRYNTLISKTHVFQITLNSIKSVEYSKKRQSGYLYSMILTSSSDTSHACPPLPAAANFAKEDENKEKTLVKDMEECHDFKCPTREDEM